MATMATKIGTKIGTKIDSKMYTKLYTKHSIHDSVLYIYYEDTNLFLSVQSFQTFYVYNEYMDCFL
jgi:hypothetical protein